MYFEADPPNVPWANDLIVSLDRKDIDGAAAFFVVTDGRTEYDHGEKVRVISAARLLSVAVCAFSDYMEGTAATATNNSKSSAAGSLYLPILQTQGRLQ